MTGLDAPVTALSGVGPAIAEKLGNHVGKDGVVGHRRDIERVFDIHQTVEAVVRQDLGHGQGMADVGLAAEPLLLAMVAGWFFAQRRSELNKTAQQAVDHAGQYAYRDRKVRKRNFRSLWIQRINAAARECGLSYSRMINGLSKAEVDIDRKVLADLAVHDKAAFSALADKAKDALAA